MKAQDRRDAVLHEIREQTEHLFFGNADDYDVAKEASAKWRQALTSLKTDPDAVLP